MSSPVKNPLSAFVGTIQDGRFLRFIFLGLLALSVATVAQDLNEMVANAPFESPGTQRLEPAPMDLPQPGDQLRPYLPKTMPLAPSNKPPRLPGYFGPLDGTVMSAPMKFHLGDDGKASAIGTIDAGAAKRLSTFLADNDREIGELYLHSPGGSVSDALAMSNMVRDAGISTNVPANAYCASSCPLVLAGGLYRKSGENSFIGVHQVFALPTATGSLHKGMSDAQSISAACQAHLSKMGIDLQVWVNAMATPPKNLYLFTPDELPRYRLANSRIRVTAPSQRPIATSSASSD